MFWSILVGDVGKPEPGSWVLSIISLCHLVTILKIISKHVFLKYVFSHVSRKDNPIVVDRWVCLITCGGFVWNCNFCFVCLVWQIIVCILEFWWRGKIWNLWGEGNSPHEEESPVGQEGQPGMLGCFYFVGEWMYLSALYVLIYFLVLFFCVWVSVMFLSCCYCCSRSTVSMGLLLS